MGPKYLLLVCLIAIAVVSTVRPGTTAESCVPVGTWVEPASGQHLTHPAMISRLANGGVVLLGEAHNRADHHRWQLQTIASLYGHRSDLVMAFEMFPRRVQPVLEKWVDGQFGAEEFLTEVSWNRTWGIDPALYMPLLDFAAMNRVRTIALNIDSKLVKRVGEEGWQAIPPDDREGISNPLPATDAYRAQLKKVYLQHLDDDHPATNDPDKLGPDDPEFLRFVEAQLLWDRAFAEAIVETQSGADSPLVVAIIGMSHLEHGYGVPRQLASLGVEDPLVLLPWDVNRDCADLSPDLASAIFGVRPPKQASSHGATGSKPRLGVYIEDGDGGVLVTNVAEGSVAEAADVRAKDVIVKAAGVTVARTSELITVVHRQAPGTWLPLLIRRQQQDIEIIAKFPAHQ